MQKRRRVLAKTHLVKRLRLSINDWQTKRLKIERRTTARESTLALLRKAKSSKDECDPTIDPITREKLSKTCDVFVFKRGTSIARVDACSLIDYILSTGDYSDPESRVPFDDDALRRLDQIGARIGKPSVMKARENLKAKLSERHFLQDAMCGLERVCGESVTQMFELVEAVGERKMSIDEAQLQLLAFILPEFQGSFSQLVEADKNFAKESAEQFEAFLRGPPNKPVRPTVIQNMVLETYRASVASAFE